MPQLGGTHHADENTLSRTPGNSVICRWTCSKFNTKANIAPMMKRTKPRTNNVVNFIDIVAPKRLKLCTGMHKKHIQNTKNIHNSNSILHAHSVQNTTVKHNKQKNKQRWWQGNWTFPQRDFFPDIYKGKASYKDDDRVTGYRAWSEMRWPVFIALQDDDSSS